MQKAPESDLSIQQAPPAPDGYFPYKGDISLSVPEPASLPSRKKSWWLRVRFDKLGIFLISLYLFILAIMLMKDGAKTLSPLIQDMTRISSTANSLGFGWLFAYLIMSGSPVAAAALTFFDSGVINELGAFAMITGSRLGAGFIVLLIGFLYVIRGRNRATSLSMGLLSLSITWSTYLPAFFLGILLLNSGLLDPVQIQQGALLTSVTGVLITPALNFITGIFPKGMVFIIGLAIIYLSFSLFDKSLPQMAIKDSQVGWVSRLVYRPVVMFIFGALVTLLSMSVSISLSILVPLSNRGFIRRENVIPYIMGANITTFIDTLLAAVLLGNPPAFTIVLIEMISVTIISLIVLCFGYARFQKTMLNFIDWITRREANLAIFLSFLVLIPILLILV